MNFIKVRRVERGTTNGGIGIFGLLGVIFIVLKIIGVEPIASWSWWWVTFPIWGGMVLFFLVAFLFFVASESLKQRRG